MIAINLRCESLDAVAPAVVTLVAAKAVDVLPNRTQDGVTVAYRFVQNLTGADLYYCIADTADNVSNFHGVIQDRVQLSVPTKHRVSVWSAAGGVVAVLELVKNGL